MNEFFEYPSAVESDSIRLLKILPPSDSTSAEIEAGLETVPLLDGPTFHALSYTWGRAEEPLVEPSKDTPDDRVWQIRLNNQSFTVTTNLYEALLQLRVLDQAVFYWIDAICINQRDITERSAQVNIMEKIYQTAEKVVVWLGSGNDSIQQISKIVARLASLSTGIGDEWYDERKGANMYDFEDEEFVKRIDFPPMDDQLWRKFAAFLERRWFRRTWILQEVALAQAVTVLCGDAEMSWSDLSECSQFLSISNLSKRLADLRREAKPSDTHIYHVGTTASMIDWMQKVCHGRSSDLGWEYTSFSKRMTGSPNVVNTTSGLFTMLLYMTRSFQATDTRDKIFALLGILSEVARINNIPPFPMRADYEKSIGDVLRDATKTIMEETDNLSLLGFVPHQRAEYLANSPSWVVDFGTQGPNPLATLNLTTENLRFNAPGTLSNPTKAFSFDGNALLLQGVPLGKVTGVGDTCNDMVNKGEWNECAKLMLDMDQIYPHTGQDRIEALWRTLITDQDETNYPAAPEIGEAFKSWLRYLLVKGIRVAMDFGSNKQDHLLKLSSLEDLAKVDVTDTIPTQAFLLECCKEFETEDEEDVTQSADNEAGPQSMMESTMKKGAAYHAMAFSSLVYRRLFRTEDGYLGLGPESLGVGDRAWIVSEYQTPLLLRADRDVGGLHLVGEVYMHGLMHGEAVANINEWTDIQLY